MAGVKHTSLSLSLGPGQGDVPTGLQDLATSPPDSSTTLTLPTWTSGCFWTPQSAVPPGPQLWPPCLAPSARRPQGLRYPPCLQVLTRDCPAHLFTLSSRSWLFLFMDVDPPDVIYSRGMYLNYLSPSKGTMRAVCLQLSPASDIYQVS